MRFHRLPTQTPQPWLQQASCALFMMRNIKVMHTCSTHIEEQFYGPFNSVVYILYLSLILMPVFPARLLVSRSLWIARKLL